jgi:hypothetical protein
VILCPIRNGSKRLRTDARIGLMSSLPRPQPNPWFVAARKALDTWGPNAAFPIAAAIRDAHADGLKRAAKLPDEVAQPLLAMQLRRLAEEIRSAPVMPIRAAAKS